MQVVMLVWIIRDPGWRSSRDHNPYILNELGSGGEEKKEEGDEGEGRYDICNLVASIISETGIL